MDWSLVLASQEIDAEIAGDDSGYSLLVREEDYLAACRALEEYDRENERSRESQLHPVTPLALHPGAFLWAVLMLFFFAVTEPRPELKDWGIMDHERFLAGEWWRPITAVGLHQDAAHLLSNLTFGVIFLGLSMTAYGFWPALIISLAAGVSGNLLGLLVYPPPFRSLGSSGMVMAALGLLAAFGVKTGSVHKSPRATTFRAVGAAVLMLVLIGFSPQADVVAHVGGFILGAIGGFLWLALRPPRVVEAEVKS